MRKQDTLIGKRATHAVLALMNEGWEFMLHYGDHTGYSNIGGNSWEANFTRKLEHGGWDNHECGYALTPNAAVMAAYKNIKEGRRLKSQFKL